VNDVLSIIKAERLKYSNMKNIVEQIINNWFLKGCFYYA
jgi:hypothetical protein